MKLVEPNVKPKSFFKSLKNTSEMCDKNLLVTITFLLVIGVMAVFSASAPRCISANINILHYVTQHFMWLFLGLVGMVFFINTDYAKLKKFTFPLAITIIVLLLIIKFTPLGVSINGAKRWLNLGVQFQPSELAKISVIMLLASFFTIKESFRKYNIFKYFAPILLMIALIYKQPNLSMTIILLAVVVCMYVCSTKNIKLIVSLVLLAVLGVGLVATNIIDLSKYIEPYQLSRITNWQNPESDIQGGGYNVFHSLIAISSGGIVGEGYGASKEKLGWLPECHTDFIFAVIAEEMGLIGTILIIGLFWTFLQRGLLISHRCSDAYGKLLAAGISLVITIQAYFNISVASAFLPATGITLPFISYGGTSLMVSLWMVGILLNISIKRGNKNNLYKFVKTKQY